MLPRTPFSLTAKAFWVSFILHLLVLLPILVADRFIFDDLGRATEGWILWINDGRPLTDFVMRLVDLGAPWVDLSPLPQIGELICYAGLAVLVMRRFQIGSPTVAALAALPLGLNPFTLENFARKYDSLPMALSILCMLLPILLTRRDPRIDIIFGAACLIGGLCFYQSSLNLFLVFTVVEMVWEQRRGADVMRLSRLLLTRALAVLLALFIYRFIAAATVRGPYSTQASALALGIGDLPLIAHNLFADWDFLLSSLPRLYRNLFFGTALLGSFLMIATQVSYARSYLKNTRPLVRTCIFLVGCFLPILWFAGSTGFLIFLRNSSVVVPHFFIGIGGLVASGLILIVQELEIWKVQPRWQCGLLAPLAYALIMFGVVYGNAVKEQKLYEQRIGTRLVVGLQKLATAQPYEGVLANGDVGLAPLVVHAAKRFRLIRSLIEIQQSADSGFFRVGLRYLGIAVPTRVLDSATAHRIDRAATPPVLRDPNFEVYRQGDQLIVFMKQAEGV
jgi:hypothetical protein